VSPATLLAGQIIPAAEGHYEQNKSTRALDERAAKTGRDFGKGTDEVDSMDGVRERRCLIAWVRTRVKVLCLALVERECTSECGTAALGCGQIGT